MKKFKATWNDPHDPPTTIQPSGSAWDTKTGREIAWNGDARLIRGGFLFLYHDQFGDKKCSELQDLRTGETWKVRTAMLKALNFDIFSRTAPYLIAHESSHDITSQTTKIHLWKMPKR